LAVNKQPKMGDNDKQHVTPSIGARHSPRSEVQKHCSYIHHRMFRQSVRRFATTAVRAATEGSTAYCTRVSTAQGVVNGLTEGMYRS
jgi:hypothetical protein